MRSLITNQIHDTCGCHDERMPLLRCFQSSRSQSSPSLDDNAFGQETTVGQFVPANHFSSFAAHVVTHPFHKVTLQVFFIVQMFIFHPCLTKRALFPISFLRFITSQMDIAGRKQSHHFIQNILQKSKGTIFSRTVDHS